MAMSFRISSIAEFAADSYHLTYGAGKHLERLWSKFERARTDGDTIRAKRLVERFEWIARNIGNETQDGYAWSTVGAAHWALGQQDAAISAYRRAEASYSSIKHETGEYHSKRAMGSILLVRGPFSEGERLLLECAERLTQLKEPVQSALCWHHLAHASLERGDNRKAAKYATLALELFEANNRPDGASQALCYQAQALVHLGRLDEANCVATEYLKRSRTSGVEIDILAAELTMAHIGFSSGDLKTAEGHLTTALNLCREHKDAETLLSTATILWGAGFLERSIELIDEAVEAASSAERSSSAAAVLISKGFQLVHAGELAEGEAALRSALRVFEIEGGRKGLAYCKNNLADALRFKGEWRSASQLYGESLAIKLQDDDEWGATYSLEGLAECAARLGCRGDAAQLLAAADEIRERLGAPIERPLRVQLERIRQAVGSTNEAPQITEAGNAESSKSVIAWAVKRAEALAKGT